MTWPIPQPGEIASRAAATFEAEFQRIYALKTPGAAPIQVDARSPFSTLAVYAVVLEMAAFDLWAFLPRAAQELMVDTAVDWLPRHAAIWGVPQIQAVVATGNALFQAGSGGVTVPAGLALTAPGGAAYVTVSSVAIAAGLSASVPIAAAVAGSAGSLPAGTVLTVVNPLAGLASQRPAVDSGGLTGQDAETVDAWRARILARIRQRGTGGNADDYVQWSHEVFPAALVSAFSPAVGLVTVCFAMPAGSTWRAPTSPEIASLSAYLNDAAVRGPLGAPFITVVGATLVPVNFSLHLSPNTAATQAAAVAALTAQMLADAVIPDAWNSGTIYLSRMDAALANASGEYSHERTVPSADVTVTVCHLAVLGSVTFA